MSDEMINTQALSLTELLAVIIVVGILAAIALPNFAPMRESVLDRESNASLKLIQAAQKIYKLETGSYFRIDLVTESNIATINQNLRIMLPVVAASKWNYRCTYSDGGTKSCADATRTAVGGGNNRQWHLKIDETDQSSGPCP